MKRNGVSGRGVGVALAAAALAGCNAPSKNVEAAPELAQFVVTEIPETAHREFIDFGGKIELVAYDLSPDGKAGPGQSVHAKYYWKPVSVIGQDWALFTHVQDARGGNLRNLDGEGPFRKWLVGKAPDGLDLLELANIYVDEQTFDMPKAEDLTPEVLLVVGVYTEDRPHHYTNLPVVSGPSDGHQAGVVARIDTGVQWPKLAAKRDDKEIRR